MLPNILPFGSLVVFCLAILLGAFTNGLAGMAFAAVSGGLILAVLPAKIAIPVLAVGGLLLQVCNNAKMVMDGQVTFRREEELKEGQVSFRTVLYYIIPGFVGVPFGSELLHVLPKQTVALVFGLVLLGYVAFTFRKKPGVENKFGGRTGEMAAGLVGGVAAGMLALPGIPAVIWASIRNYNKKNQRALTVPFNFSMLLFSIAVNGLKGNYHEHSTQLILLIAIPFLLVGWYFGYKKFTAISEVGFRRFIAVVMVLSGLVLVYPSVQALAKPAPTTPVAVKTVNVK